jgi:4'-phosphopantetheinyl transferase
MGLDLGDLSGDAVHVWSATLDVPPARLALLAGHLSPDERARADRFRFERDRRRFTAARGVLREILGAYLGHPAPDVAFVYGAYGKPALAPPLDATDLAFNLAHAAGLALYGLARGRPLGIDVEEVRPLSDLLGVARSVMTPGEYAPFAALPPGPQQEAFFALWTRQEAYLKATGAGFSVRPDGFAVDDHRIRGPWRLRDLSPAPGFAACVAVVGDLDPLRCRRWEDGAAWATPPARPPLRRRLPAPPPSPRRSPPRA